jgi:gamma-glutamylputrescine oxidase
MTDPQDYPASYYAASQNMDLDAPALTGDVTADVCVIGGGFTGLASALYLTEQGAQVVLLESGRMGWGASGRNGGQVVSGYGEDTEHLVSRIHGKKAGERAWQLGFDCMDLLQETIQRHGIECDLTWGYVRAAVTNRHVRQLKHMMTHWQDRQVPGELEYVEGADVKMLAGTDAYRAAVYTTCEGHLHPLNLALGEAKAIQALGGRLYERSAATNISYDQNRGPVRITTAGGTVTAGTLVLAGNAYLEKLEPRLQRTLIPGYTAIIATKPLRDDLAQRLLPRNTALSDMRTVLDYYRLSADRRMLWGGLAHWSGNDTTHPENLLRNRMVSIYPELHDAGIDYTWSGRIGISANRNPQIGRLAPNVYYAQAYSGHGIASTHLSARMITDAIQGTSDDFEMFAAIPHLAIPVNSTIHQLARAWGMNSRRIIEWF